MKEPVWLVRTIEWFSNETEELVGEVSLPPVELRVIQNLWNASTDAPMVECFPIGEAQAPFFRRLSGIEFNFKKYSYFLSSFTIDNEATIRDGGYMGKYPPPRTFEAFPDLKKVMPKTRVVKKGRR